MFKPAVAVSFKFISAATGLVSLVTNIGSVGSSGGLPGPVLVLNFNTLVYSPVVSPYAVAFPTGGPHASPYAQVLFSVKTGAAFLTSATLVFLA